MLVAACFSIVYNFFRSLYRVDTVGYSLTCVLWHIAICYIYCWWRNFHIYLYSYLLVLTIYCGVSVRIAEQKAVVAGTSWSIKTEFPSDRWERSHFSSEENFSLINTRTPSAAAACSKSYVCITHCGVGHIFHTHSTPSHLLFNYCTECYVMPLLRTYVTSCDPLVQIIVLF